MLTLLGRLLGGSKKRKTRRRVADWGLRDARAALVAELSVHALEERRVFHAGAIVPAPQPAESAPPTPPPPTTTVTLDASQNLLVQDASTSGQNDQLSIRLNAEEGRYEIYDPNQILSTDIDGATGSGTHRVYVPIAAVSGSKLIVDTGAGNDALAVDLSDGLGGKTLTFNGGEGTDALSLVGGTYTAVGYAFAADGMTQIQVGAGTDATWLELDGVEPIFDDLRADMRTFLAGGLTNLTLGDDAVADDGRSLLSLSTGTSVTFAAPLVRLEIGGLDDAARTLSVTGLDSQFAGDLRLNAGAAGHLAYSGHLNLHGGSLSAHGASIDLAGTITSHAATIDLRAESSLIVAADGIIDNAAGRVVLDAGTSGTLLYSGRIDVSADGEGETGGTVHLLGKEVKLLDQAAIDASGHSGGGKVLVGGDYQGLNAAIHRATNTYVGAEVSIQANALVNGDGGTIIVWADEAAIVAGSGNLQARGGVQGGDGGLIETSGKQYLYVAGAADAGTYLGQAGMWLLDPFDVEIVAGTANTIPGSGNFDPSSGNPANGPTLLGADTIEAALATTNVTIFTGNNADDEPGNITITDGAIISVALAMGVSRTLTLHAANDIVIEAGGGISETGAGTLNVVLMANSAPGGGNTDGDTNAGDVIIDGTIDTGGGNFTSGGINFANTGTITTGAMATTGTVTILHKEDVTIGAAITAAGHAEIESAGGNIELDAATVTAGSAEVRALAGTLTVTDSDVVAVDTSAADGAVTLEGDGGIGASGELFGIAADGGSVALLTDDADIYLASTSDLRLDAVDTNGGASRVVHIEANATPGLDITVAAASSTNDQWLLDASGNIVFSAAISAASFTATAGGAITSPTATTKINTSAANGAINLSAADGIGTSVANPFTVNAGTGTVTLTTTSATAGHIFLSSAATLRLGTVTTDATSAQTVDLRATGAGNDLLIVATSDTNDHWNLVAADDIGLVASVTLTADSATLTAGGSVTGGSAAIDLTATTISITADAIGTTSDSLVVRPGSLALSVATGGAYVDIDTNSAGFATSQLTVTRSGIPSDDTIELTVLDGDFAIGSAAGFVNLAGDNLTLTTAGTDNDIQLTGSAAFNAESITLTASGAITAAAGSVLSSQAGQSISLTGDTIGTSAAPVVFNPGGQLSVVSAGDIFLRKSAGDLATNIFTQLTSSAIGATISIGTLDGSVLVNGTAGFAVADDNVEVVANGPTAVANIAFSAMLTAASVRLDAEDAITSLGGNAVDIDTSAAGGNIQIEAGGPIGDSANPLVVRAGTGQVSVQSTGLLAAGDIYVSSSGALNLGAVSTDVATSQTVSFATTGSGDLTLGASNTSNDHWQLSSAGDLVVGATTTIEAASFQIQAVGAVVGGGNNVDFQTTNPTLVLAIDAATIGTEAQPLSILHAGDFTLTSDLDIWLRLVATNVNLGDFTGVTMTTPGSTLGLIAADGSILIPPLALPGLSAQNLFLQTEALAGDILFLAGDATLNFASVELRADQGSILNLDVVETVVNIQTSGGPITLQSMGPIGGPTAPIYVSAGTGDVSAVTTGLVGDIFLRSATQLDLGLIDTEDTLAQTVHITSDVGLTVVADSVTEDNWTLQANGGGIAFAGGSIEANTIFLTASGAITRSGSAGTDVTANAISLIGTSIGASTSRLAVDPQGGTLAVQATSGDVYLAVTSSGGFRTSQFAPLSPAVPFGATFDLLVTGGELQVDSFVDLFGSNAALRTAADNDIRFAGGLLFADTVVVAADGAILSDNLTADEVVALGTIALTGNTGIGAPGAAIKIASLTPDLVTLTTTAVGGDIHVRSNTDLRLGAVNTDGSATQAVDIASLGWLQFEASSNTNDAWNVFAAGDIRFVGAASLVAESASLTSSLGAIVSGTAALDLQTSGNIVLAADLGIGEATNPLSVATGASGAVTANTRLGAIYLSSPGALRLEAANVSGASGAIIDLSAATDLQIVGSSSTNDAWNLVAGGDIAFIGTASVVGQQLTATAGGQLLSGTAATDVEVTAGGASLVLNADGGVGDSGNAFAVLTPGDLTVTTAASDIYVESTGPLRLGSVSTGAGGSTQTVSFETLGAGNSILLTTLYDTNDDWFLTASGAVRFIAVGELVANSVEIRAAQAIVSGPSDTTTDIRLIDSTGAIDLAGASIGAAGNELRLDPSGGELFLNAISGDIYVDIVAGSLSTDQIELLRTSAGANTVQLRTLAGALTIADVSKFTNTSGDHFVLASGAGADIVFANSQALQVASARVDSDGAVRVVNALTPSNKLVVGGLLTIEAATTIGAAGTPLWFAAPNLITDSGGGQHLYAVTATRIHRAASGGDIHLVEGTFRLAPLVAGDGITAAQLVVEGGAVFGGTGTVQGDYWGQANSLTDPGYAAIMPGRIEIIGNARFETGATLLFDLASPFQVAGQDYDTLVVRGNLDLDFPTLEVRGDGELPITVNPIMLVRLEPGSASRTGQFLPDAGSLVRTRTGLQVEFGLSRSPLIYDGGDGNDIVLVELVVVPVLPLGAIPLPRIELPVFTRPEVPPPEREPPQVVSSPTDPPLIEREAGIVSVRKLRICVLVPIDSEGNFEEREVFELKEEWLKNLTALFLRLPDDRYRIYLVLDDNDQRLVMDVFLRNGRPYDPSESLPQFAPAAAPAGELPIVPPAAETPGLPEGSALGDHGAAWIAPPDEFPMHESRPAAGRYFVGASAAAAAVVASRRSRAAWQEQMDAAAAELGGRPRSGSRWWRLRRRELAASGR